MHEISLNGSWRFAFFEGQFLEDAENPAFVPVETICVPGCFDTMPEYCCKRGTAMYRKTFCLEHDVRNAFLVVDGMGLRCRFRVDGREIGFAALPYSKLEFETGPLSAGEHTLTAALDNSFDSEKVKLFLPNYDFYAFGGFYHGVSLRLQERPCELDTMFVRMADDYQQGGIELEFLFKGGTPEEFDVTLRFDGAEATESFHVTGARLAAHVPSPTLWTPDSPNLHRVTATVNGTSASVRFGLRKIEAKHKRILLNGEAIYLKGFNRHESHLEFGAATPEQLMIEDIQHLHAMHCNFVRGCHYPQSQRFLDLCDENGILIWEESLGWGNRALQMADPEYIRLQIEQTRLMVRNSFNHPCVIFFAFQNENESSSPEGQHLNHLLTRTIKAENSGRLVTFACNHNANDISNDETDVISYNSYPGWIVGSPDLEPNEQFVEARDRILDYYRTHFDPEKPIIVSEMGACALYGQHDEAATQWSEEFQAEYIESLIHAVFESDEIQGLLIWHMNDAKSYHRKGAGIRTKPLAQNLAGVYDAYRRPKLAVEVVKKLYGERR